VETAVVSTYFVAEVPLEDEAKPKLEAAELNEVVRVSPPAASTSDPAAIETICKPDETTS